MAAKKRMVINDSSGEEEETEEIDRTTMRTRNRKKQKNDRSAASLQEENERLLKQLQKLQSQAKKVAHETTSSVEEDEYESEEEDDNGDLTSSMQILPAIQADPKGADLSNIKRVSAAAARKPAKTSSRAFKTVVRDNEQSDSEQHDGASIDTPAHTVPRSSSPTTDTNSSHRSSSIPPNTLTDTHKENMRPPGAINSIPGGLASTSNIPAIRDGIKHDPKKPKASDFEDTVQALILRASFEYEAFISTTDAFPSLQLRHQWAAKCWNHALKDTGQDYQLTDVIGRLIRQRSSRIRGQAVTTIRSIVDSSYGFKKKTDPKTVANNIETYQKFRGVFHYKKPEERLGFAEGKIIQECIQAVWFDNKNSHGIVFKNMFNPISLGTLSLVFTAIDHCLEEWSTGRHLKTGFEERTVSSKHQVFRADLVQWSNQNESVVKAIREKFFKRICRDAGISIEPTIKPTLTGDSLVQVRNELAGRTGETDSEAEE
ncbi:hypothetical protein CVT24_009446 [Panaeolus cyanescens]|uniref:DUF6532 domain-containing protein n=1 Tax=Panaeolus cyanescens TaxID=181874 RepID=A0A409WCH3_9AGAR|nr:hypothetical protein CVT24_009446 [Panaeolus cyanescens]